MAFLKWKMEVWEREQKVQAKEELFESVKQLFWDTKKLQLQNELLEKELEWKKEKISVESELDLTKKRLEDEKMLFKVMEADKNNTISDLREQIKILTTLLPKIDLSKFTVEVNNPAVVKV